MPEAVQDVITSAELEALQTSGEDDAQALALFRAVVLRGELAGLTANQLAAVREIHAQARQRYRLPRYGTDPEFVCQIHLDYRVIRGDAVTPLREGARLLLDKANARYHVFLQISHPVPRQAPIRLPLSLQSWTLRRLLGHDGDVSGETTLKSLVLEIGPRRVGVKAVLSRTKPATDPATITHVLARDFGYTNTVALSLIRLDAALDAERLSGLAGRDKGAAVDYLRSHYHPGEKCLRQRLFSGHGFLAAIARSAARIDALRSEIDHHYRKIHRLREIIGAHLGLDASERIERDMAIGEPFVKQLAVKLFRLLDRVQGLKERRRALYRRIAGIKKAWFGYLSNIEVRLARTHNAAVVREDLTVMAAQKGSPGYKGRTFNRMINNGAKGQYLRRANDKLQWNGVPEWTVPSYYTSSTCYKHARIDPSMRKGEVFHCPQCARDEHADLHAAETIGHYFQLRPLPELA